MARYLLLTEGAAYFPELLQPFERAGLYNWLKCFEGEVRLWGDIKKRTHDLKDYDIIHVNSYGQDQGLAAEVAPLIEGSQAKLVVNMDLSINYFDKDLNFPAFVRDILAADALFSVEPAQVNLVNYIAHRMGRKKPKRCTLLPHPIDIKLLMDKAWIPYSQRMDMIAFQYHKYDAHWSIPKVLAEGLDWLTCMMGYIGPPLPVEGLRHCVMPYMEWDKYLSFLSRCKLGFEYRTHRAASRFVMEAGSLGIPVVTTTESHMGQLVYPELSLPPEDFMGLRMTLERLIDDDDYRLQQARDGLERLEAYNFDNSRKRFMEMIQ